MLVLILLMWYREFSQYLSDLCKDRLQNAQPQIGNVATISQNQLASEAKEVVSILADKNTSSMESACVTYV